MKLIILTLMLSVSFLLTDKAYAKCQFEFKDICAEVKFKKKPSRSYSSDFTLHFYDKKTKKLKMPNFDVHSYIWMNMGDHSHGSSEVLIEKKKDYYLIKNVWFVMVGSWELHVSLGDKENPSEKKKIIVKIGK